MSPTPLTALARLVDFTHEDHEAKGLRKFAEDAAPQPPVHFSVIEMLGLRPALLLHAPRGAGRSTLARALASAFAEGDMDALTAPLARGPDGPMLPQNLDPAFLPPLPVQLWQPEQGDWAALFAEDMPAQRLMILDGLPADPAPLLAAALTAVAEGARLLVLLDSASLDLLDRPAALPAYRLMGLPRQERALRVAQDPVAGDWAEPGLWALSLAKGQALDLRAAAALPDVEAPWLAPARLAQEWLGQTPEAVLAGLRAEGVAGLSAFALLVGWLSGKAEAAPLARAVLTADLPLPVLLASEPLFTPATPDGDALAKALAAGLAEAQTFPLRRTLGEALSRLGDPRDLTALCAVAAGEYPMGSTAHPNSAPPHLVDMPAYRIGKYPVTNRDYARFIAATGRAWRSQSGHDPARQNHPATDLTWHDARAYCDWATPLWQAEGCLAADEHLRLPSEREWEAAARGSEGLFWPWGAEWAPLCSNGEESGFNDTCAVGLFPAGDAASGAADLAGNIWEWCLTLWGPDMAQPDFAFPWADDGRETADAPAGIRRVLRGGCFSSPEWKANGIYRGSLEPAGFWRGNGFRMVAARS